MNPLSGLPTDVDHLCVKLFWVKPEFLAGGRIRIRILNERGVVLETWDVRDEQEGVRRLVDAGYWNPTADISWNLQYERFVQRRR